MKAQTKKHYWLSVSDKEECDRLLETRDAEICSLKLQLANSIDATHANEVMAKRNKKEKAWLKEMIIAIKYEGSISKAIEYLEERLNNIK